MNNRQLLNGKNGFYATLFLVAVALAFLAPHAAVNVDEQLHYPHAKKVVNWYFTAGSDTSCLHTPETNLKYYGQSVDNLTALVNRIFGVEDEFLTRHYIGALFFLLLLYFTGLMSRRLSGSWLTATVTLLALVFMPRLSGHAFGNLKDIPFAAGYMAGLLMIGQFLKELPHPRWKTTILLGLSIAFTVSVRAGGFILFAYLGFSMIIFFIAYPSMLKKIVTEKPILTGLTIRGLSIVLIGYFAGLLFWPYALQNVFVNPLESLGVMENYVIAIRQVFEGELIWSDMLPWYYLPKWLLISTTGFVLTGFLLFLIHFISKIFRGVSSSNPFLSEGFVLFSFLFPFFYVLVIGSNLYSGVRQMIFILPPVAVLATLGVYKTLKYVSTLNKKAVYPLSLLFFLMLVWPVKHQISTFPVDYVYFNAMAGGNKKAWGNYEYDYYFHGLRKPAEYLIEIIGEENVTVAMNCNLSNYFDGHDNINYQYTRYLERGSKDWDYGLFGVNYIHPYLLRNNLWQPSGTVKTFYHRGNPVAVLVKRENKDDFYGILEINQLNYERGTELLERSLENDPNNVWTIVYLARAKLAENNKEEFLRYLSKGKEIHPWYEPLLLLEARQLYEAGKYRESLNVLNNLSEINPYYRQKDHLTKLVNEKLRQKI
jgi:tetratricopeptide (TPR) repeat protein